MPPRPVERATPARRPAGAATPRDATRDRDRDLVAAIRAELASVEPARACDRAAEAEGLGAAATGRAPTPAVARLAVRLATPSDARPFEWDTAAHHCRIAYLRGRFLARGSLTLATGSVHLEFVVSPAEAPDLVERLGSMGLPASWRERRGRGVVTWKNTETVVTFLRRAGATASLLELESRLVTRALHGELNRVINAEASNLRRSVVSSVRQVAAIRRLDLDGRLARLAAPVRKVAGARLDAPEATYSELAAAAGTSRGFVQRALARLEALAREPDASTSDAEARAAEADHG